MKVEASFVAPEVGLGLFPDDVDTGVDAADVEDGPGGGASSLVSTERGWQADISIAMTTPTSALPARSILPMRPGVNIFKAAMSIETSLLCQT